jgi:hypothetical protein
MGDNQQFSNVKSTLARSDINQGYLNSLREVFEQHISTATDQLARLEKFNIKVSILDFFEFINNYKTRLVKHFRGYKEIISYSDKFFYGGSLQVMKIRGKPVQEVIQFTVLPHDGLKELKRNTNSAEADFIIQELQKIKEQGTTLFAGASGDGSKNTQEIPRFLAASPSINPSCPPPRIPTVIVPCANRNARERPSFASCEISQAIVECPDV